MRGTGNYALNAWPHQYSLSKRTPAASSDEAPSVWLRADIDATSAPPAGVQVVLARAGDPAPPPGGGGDGAAAGAGPPAPGDLLLEFSGLASG